MLVLASKSPRRKEFLEKSNLEFIIDTVETEEVFNNELSIEDALIDIARQKVMPVYKKHPTDTILGADTIVVCENQILGKPKNIEHAKQICLDNMIPGILIILITHIIIAIRWMFIKILSAVINGREWFKVIVPGFVTVL